MLQKNLRACLQSKSILSIVICVACILTLTGMALAQTATAPATGDGSEGSPYQIATLENLYWIAADSARWDKHYIQTADIDASATSEWNGGEGWTPIGSEAILFAGIYDGGGHTIDRLFIYRYYDYYDDDDFQGLFGVTAPGSQIKNLGVINVDMQGDEFMGGLVGYNSGTVSNCYATGNAEGYGGAGGLVGINAAGSMVINCNAAVVLFSTWDGGGLVGYNYGTVSNCYATEWVGSAYGAAGLVNYNYGTVSNCYASGSVNSYQEAAGLVFYNLGTVSNCYASGSVVDTHLGAAGLVYYNSGTVSNCYATGYVHSDWNEEGLVLSNHGTVSNSFYDKDTTNQSDTGKGEPKTTAEMKTMSTFTDAGWDFDEIWNIDEGFNQGYPFLRWQIPAPESDPPQVTIIAPQAHVALQDGVTFQAKVVDESPIAEVYFSVREPDGGEGISIGYDDLEATYNSDSGYWELPFDTTLLQDGYYLIWAIAEDAAGNGHIVTVPFSIRNWAIITQPPSTPNSKAGRTMPVKFSLSVAASVDPAMPFVYNEDLEIRIYDAKSPGTILQSSWYGTKSTDYRIDVGLQQYQANFQTGKKPATYVVEIWRPTKNFMIGSFAFKTVK